MTNDITFSITTTPFDEDYAPSSSSRITTNFANLARGENRRQNLRDALTMINNRFNSLANWDNPNQNRYTVELEINSINLHLPVGRDDRSDTSSFPIMEMLNVQIIDTVTDTRIDGIVGNNFSSYVRDYDFSVRLPAHLAQEPKSGPPKDFGELHGRLFTHFLHSEAYRERFTLPPVICISVSTSRTYTRLENQHPILGIEYQQNDFSLTDEYFARMGMSVRYFMPRGAVAPLAFYFRNDLLNDYSNLALIGTISTMETFQKIYRPEIYNANSMAGHTYRPSLESRDFSKTHIEYDRVERSELALKQGEFTAEHFLKPHGAALELWAAGSSV